MNKIYIYLILCALCTSCAPQRAAVETAADVMSAEAEKAEQKADARSSESMLVPADAKKTPSGYAYAVVKPGTEIVPQHTDTVEVRLCARNLDGTVIEEDTRLLSVAHSTSFFEEILPLMHVGETMRIWGDQRVIWEIEMISISDEYKAPEDYAAAPESAALLDGFDDVRYRLVESGIGETARAGQALRVHVSRWDGDGAIIESSRAGRGMLLYLNDALKKSDPVHYAAISKMRAGDHVRVWIPAARLNVTPKIDIVEDIWIAEFLTQLDPPEQLAFPEIGGDVGAVGEGAALRFDSRRADRVPLADSQAVEVDMTCWKSDTGELVDATYTRDRRDVMELTEHLGIWLDIMKKAAPGDTLTAWIKKSALPENVGLDLTCRVTVYDVVPAAAPSRSDAADAAENVQHAHKNAVPAPAGASAAEYDSGENEHSGDQKAPAANQ